MAHNEFKCVVAVLWLIDVMYMRVALSQLDVRHHQHSMAFLGKSNTYMEWKRSEAKTKYIFKDIHNNK